MTDVWESAFAANQTMWGEAPARAAVLGADEFARRGAREVLIPGVGYGRNAKPFLAHGMRVTGIEISETAIGLARAKLGLDFAIHHGSVTDMPFDDRTYDGVFAFGLVYLLSAEARAKFLADCRRQLAPGGAMIVTLISKRAPMYGVGPKLGEDLYERHPGMPMFFYDEASVAREFGPHGEVVMTEVDEASGGRGATLPFLYVVVTTRS